MGGAIDVLNTLREVGVIVGEASSNEFLFSSKPSDMPSRWEYLLVYSEEEQDGVVKQVEVVAQVEKVISVSQALSKELDFEIIKKLIESGLADSKVWGQARVLGYLTERGELQLPKKAVMPGKPVYVAPTELLERFYNYSQDEAISIGSLITRSEVPVALSVKGFRRHLAVLAQTGSGKTYLAGILADELLAKGGTVIMLDPHADYVFLGRAADGRRHELSDRVTVFRNPASTGRYSEGEVGRVEPYEVCFSDLDIDEICLIANIGKSMQRIREGLEQAFELVKEKKDVFQPEDLLEELEAADEWKKRGGDFKLKVLGAKAAKKYIKQLVKMGVFTSASTSIDAMLKPQHLSVVDLSGLNDEVADYIAYSILTDIYEKAASNELEFPVFIFVEEAHRFIPYEGRTDSSSIIKKIAAEGRKFGVFLVVITQRPSKIHPDTLSQCNSQIILRITNPDDQMAIAKSSERLGQTLLEDLPGLNTGEAVIVGEMTRAPVMVKIKARRTKEGGSDIDIVAKLKAAVERARQESPENESSRLRSELQGFMTDSE
ncbi:MAG: ATP-binding protein [Candidatus Bathyarchaeota archaeon]|nr:ATP-binding protein [Candidatus Bathyarchaeota archaeon]